MSIGQRRDMPEPLRCAACTAAFGGAVAFCPFCGAAQAAVAALPEQVPTPGLELDQGKAASEIDIPLPATPPAAAVAAMAASVKAAKAKGGAVAAPPVPTLAQTSPKRWHLWKRLAFVAAAGFVGFAYLRENRIPAPGATLMVQVRAPNGAAVTSGRILVDGTPVGVPGESLRVSPGSHGVSFIEPGWRSEPRPVSLARDASVTLTLTAQEVPARVSIASHPTGAVVRVRGRSLGRTPLDFSLDAGSYDVLVALDGYVSKVLPLALGRGDSRSLSVDLAEVPLPQPAPPRLLAAPFDRGVVTAITALQSGPSRSADTIGMLPSLSEVQVQAQVATEETWLQVRANGRLGFVRANSTVEPWENWSQRSIASGPIEAVTASLRVVIAGTSVALAGVRPPDRSPPGPAVTRVWQALGAMLKGTVAQCVPHDTASFQCKTADGRDVAELYLLNGGAAVSAKALPYYADAQRTAQEKQKGLWSD